jgi:predicted nuclease with TOPRIM domain
VAAGFSFLGEKAMNTTVIRPALQSLRRMPTLHQVAEAWGKLELKLETEDTRYWITTEGVPHKTSGTPINYVIDYVTVEKLSEDGNWDLKAVYSPEAWKLSQAFDYCQILYQELNRLNAEQEESFRWETVREIEKVEAELENANKAVFELSEKVRSRWS